MKLFGRDVPCGCESRKDIIFTQGNAGLPELVTLLLIGAVLVGAYAYGHRKVEAS